MRNEVKWTVEMEHIDDNSIRVLIRAEDLEQRGINLMIMMRDQREAEKFFYNIIEELNVQDKFRDTDHVSFQVMPSLHFKGAIELIISRGELPFFQDSIRFFDKLRHVAQCNEFKSFFVGECEEPSPLSKEEKEAEAKRIFPHFVVEFDNFEDVINVARSFKISKASSELYEADGIYYLHVCFSESALSVDEIENYKSLLLEFGKCSTHTDDELQEHAKLVIKKVALESIDDFFKI